MNLNKNDKKILVLYALVGISFVVTLSYFDLILERPPTKDNVDGDISRTLIDKKIIEGNNTKNFELITNLEDYPIYLPRNIFDILNDFFLSFNLLFIFSASLLFSSFLMIFLFF